MYRSDITFKQLEAFVYSAQLGTISAAAEALGRAQPTVSKELLALERRLGYSLLERTRIRVTLTRRGKELIDGAASLLEARDCFLASGAGLERNQPVRVVCSPSIANKLMPRVLQRLEEIHPDLTVEVMEVDTGGVESVVATGGADVGLCHLATATEGLNIAELGFDALAFVGHRDVVEALRQGDIVKLANVPLLSWPRETHPSYFDLIMDSCRSRGLDPLVLLGAQRLGGARRYLLEQGRAFGVVPADAAEALDPSLDFELLGSRARVPLTGVSRAKDSAGGEIIFPIVRKIRSLAA